MSEFLRQQDIDALMRGDEGYARSSAESTVVSYSFLRPPRVPHHRRKVLAIMHDRFALGLQGMLAARLRAPTDVVISSVESLTFAEFKMVLASPCAAFIFRAGPSGGVHGVLDFSAPFALHLVDRLLGGPGQSDALKRSLTILEQGVVRAIAERTLAIMRDAWREQLTIEPEIVRYESDPEMLEIANPDDPILLANFEIRSGGVTGYVTTCFTMDVVEPVLHDRTGPNAPSGLTAWAAPAALEESGLQARTGRDHRPYARVFPQRPRALRFEGRPDDSHAPLHRQSGRGLRQQASLVPRHDRSDQEPGRSTARAVGPGLGIAPAGPHTGRESDLMADETRSDWAPALHEVGTDESAAQSTALAALMDVPMPVVIEIGRTSMTIQEVLELGVGSVIQLDRMVGEPVDIYVSNRRLAQGEVVVVGEHFGIRITRLLSNTGDESVVVIGSGLISVIGALAVTLGMLAVAVFLLKRIQGAGTGGGAGVPLTVLKRISIGPKQGVVLLRVGDRVLVLSTARQGGAVSDRADRADARGGVASPAARTSDRQSRRHQVVEAAGVRAHPRGCARRLSGAHAGIRGEPGISGRAGGSRGRPHRDRTRPADRPPSRHQGRGWAPMRST